jgi:hypothetical protein
MQKNKIFLIIIFAAFTVLYSVQVQANQVQVPKGTVGQHVGPTNTHNPPAGYKGDWVFEKSCSNGAGDWVCKGKCEAPQTKEPKEREPREKPTPRPTPTPVPNPLRTTTTSQPSGPSLTPNPNWVSVLGYTDSFNQCSNLCVQYQQSNCNSQLAVEYCTSVVSLDLNKNGNIISNEIGTTPSGTKNCETNARCYDVVDNCICSDMPLNLGTCISLFFQSYTKMGLTTLQALQNIAQDTSGNCQPPRV